MHPINGLIEKCQRYLCGRLLSEIIVILLVTYVSPNASLSAFLINRSYYRNALGCFYQHFCNVTRARTNIR